MSNSVPCPYCHLPIPSDSKYCPKCGKQLHQSDENDRSAPAKIICPSCGITNDGKNAFCFGCGLPLAGPREPLRSAAAGSRKPEQKEKKRSTQPNIAYLVIGVFVLAIAVSVILEMRNSAVHSVQGKQEQPSGGPVDQLSNSTVLQDIESLENILKNDPKNSDALLQLANRLHDAKFFIRAIETYKKYLAVNPSATDPRVDLGICYFEAGDTKAAVREIEKALSIDPKHQMAMFNLGIIQLDAGNTAEARKWFQKSVDLDPASIAGKKAKELLDQHSLQ